MDIDFINGLDIFEVDKQDYDAFFFRLPKNELMKTTPYEGLTVYKDVVEGGIPICGILSEQIMAMPANRYFIFNFMDEKRLGPHKLYKHIKMDVKEYEDFLNLLRLATEEKGEDA